MTSEGEALRPEEASELPTKASHKLNFKTLKVINIIIIYMM